MKKTGYREVVVKVPEAIYNLFVTGEEGDMLGGEEGLKKLIEKVFLDWLSFEVQCVAQAVVDDEES